LAQSGHWADQGGMTAPDPKRTLPNVWVGPFNLAFEGM
jgi:hypothetical protein